MLIDYRNYKNADELSRLIHDAVVLKEEVDFEKKQLFMRLKLSNNFGVWELKFNKISRIEYIVPEDTILTVLYEIIGCRISTFNSSKKIIFSIQTSSLSFMNLTCSEVTIEKNEGYTNYTKLSSELSKDDYNIKRIVIEKVGTFCVPEEWVFTQNGNFVYFTDRSINEKGYKVYLTGVIGGGLTELYDNVIVNDIKVSYAYSNSAVFGKCNMSINNFIYEKLYVGLPGNVLLYMYDVYDLVDINTIMKIAKSYRLP